MSISTDPDKPETKQVHIKMAKASQKDMDLAVKIVQFLEAIEYGYFPLEDEESEEDNESFDAENFSDLKKFHDYIMKSFKRNPAGLMRVVWGYMVLTDPNNELINQDSDVLEIHPRFTEAINTFEKLQQDNKNQINEQAAQ